MKQELTTQIRSHFWSGDLVECQYFALEYWNCILKIKGQNHQSAAEMSFQVWVDKKKIPFCFWRDPLRMTMSWPSSRLHVTLGCGNPLALQERRAIPPSGIKTSPPPSSFSMSGGMTTSSEAVYSRTKYDTKKQKLFLFIIIRFSIILFVPCVLDLYQHTETVNVFFLAGTWVFWEIKGKRFDKVAAHLHH